MKMIEAIGLTRTFQAPHNRTVEAVRGVDFTVDEQEIVGFLGPNGAGKTTTLRMLTTLLRPTGGTATVAGHDLLTGAAAIRTRIGYVAQGGGANPAETVVNELMLQAQLYGASKSRARERTAELCAAFDLGGLEERMIGSLSGGQRRRLDVALGLVHRPALLFLDEPSAGLDPGSRSRLWEHIRDMRDNHGTTVFLSTHYLDEADALCDRILIMDQGRIIAEDSPSELKRRVAGDVVTVETAEPERARTVLEGHQGVSSVAIVEKTVRCRVEHNPHNMIDIMRLLDAAGVQATSIQVDRPTLDDVFLSLTARPAVPSA